MKTVFILYCDDPLDKDNKTEVSTVLWNVYCTAMFNTRRSAEIAKKIAEDEEYGEFITGLEIREFTLTPN